MYQETVVILKPDAIERKLTGSIIRYFDNVELEILDMRFYRKIEQEIILCHYPDSMALSIGKKAQLAVPSIKDPETHGYRVLQKLRSYFSRGPILAIRLGGEEAIKLVREVTGYTDPARANKGTIRGDLGIDSIAKSTKEGRAVENLIHASGNDNEAKKEIELWFT